MKTDLRSGGTRKPLFTLLFGIFYIGSLAAAPGPAPSIKGDETGHFLELKGIVTGNKNFLQEAEILIYEEDTTSLYFTELTNRMGRATIQLPFNRVFRLVFSKAGFISKTLDFDTHVSDTSLVQHFKFSVELYEFEPGLDMKLLSRPIAKVVFDPAVKKFDYDMLYTQMMDDQLKAMYEKFYATKPEQE
jgi:hypothetical protein